MTVGENIRTLRKKRNLTQKELAERTGIAEITIRQYEAGKYNPKLDPLRKIAAVLGVYISEIRPDWSSYSNEELSTDWREGNPGNISHKEAIELGGYPLNDSEKPLLVNYRQLNLKGKRKAADFIEDLTKIPEYQRNNVVRIVGKPLENPSDVSDAHEIPGASIEDKQFDEDLMDDDSIWE